MLATAMQMNRVTARVWGEARDSMMSNLISFAENGLVDGRRGIAALSSNNFYTEIETRLADSLIDRRGGEAWK